jgi:biotin carboxylase
MKKTLMVLGAGYGQLPAILKSQDKGYKVIATSCFGDDIGMSIADIALKIDTTDIDKILEAARSQKIDGILTMATDVAVPSMGKVVDELGLVGPSFRSALSSTNKVMMKKLLLDCDIPTAKSRFIKSITQAKDAIKALGMPVMLKASTSSGSRGITKIENLSELEGAFHYAKANSKFDTLILEEFLEGFEFGAQGLIYNGELKVFFPHNDTVTSPPYLTPIGHSYPMELKKNLENEIFDIAARSVRALKIDNSMLNFDMMITNSGPKIIEIGARMGATCLPELTTIYSGIDIVDVAIEMAIGHEPHYREKIEKQPCAGMLIRSPKSGMLEVAESPPDLSQDPRLIAIRWFNKKGDRIRKFKVGPDRIGEIVVISDSSQEAEKFCLEIEKKLSIKINANI